MITSKNARYLLQVVILPLTIYRVYAQNIDEKTYRHKMQLIDSLSFYKMDYYDTLRHISSLKNFHGTDYKEDYYGWINKQNAERISFLNINGKEFEIEKKDITEVKPLPLNQETIDSLISRDRNLLASDWGNFARNYPLALWLYKKGKFDYSKQLLPKDQTFFGDTNLRKGFGAVYYDAMLSAFSNQRDYPKAITFGEHLSGSVFNGYLYQKDAITLTRQLKNNLEDFKTFRLPDSLEWNALKQKLDRKDQILYLADRLRLLNCIQPGQPAGISYDMYQFSIPCTEAAKLNISYWGPNAKYSVINPFIELLKLKLNLNETTFLLPYLLTDTYIASYNYHRDFFPERNLHKLSWVIHDLIFEITNNSFFDRELFDSLTLDKKKTAIEGLKKWCDSNAALSREDLIINVLKTSNRWYDFRRALEIAQQQRYDSLLPVIVTRYNDFKDFYSPVHKYAISEAMFELGNEKYIGTVRKWSKDTTSIEVNLWTSMFLIKYDKDSYEPAMKELETVLRQCDGVAYYPHAMDLLLSLSDKRALKLAEGILNKSGFQQLIYWDYYENFIRKLLLAKSDYTFNFLSVKLDAYTADKLKNLHKDNDQMLTENDSYVLAVDELKNDTPGYYNSTTNTSKLEYIKALDKWFKTQYALLKAGKSNELRLNVKLVNAPVTFVDTYYR